MATKKKQPIINDTDHEIETSEGWIIPSKNAGLSFRISSHHKDTEKYILRKEGFQDIVIRKFLGEWESLDSRNQYGQDHWKKYDVNLFPEEVIREHIAKYGEDYYEYLCRKNVSNIE